MYLQHLEQDCMSALPNPCIGNTCNDSNPGSCCVLRIASHVVPVVLRDMFSGSSLHQKAEACIRDVFLMPGSLRIPLWNIHRIRSQPTVYTISQHENEVIVSKLPLPVHTVLPVSKHVP